MIFYGKQFIDHEDIKLVTKALKDDYITQGKYVNIFEKKLSEKFSKFACVVSSGTAALHLSLRAINISEGDILLASPITFVASTNAALYCKAKIDLVDISLEDYNIDLNLLENKIKFYRKKNKKIKAVIITDYAGQPADWSELRYLANKYNFFLINDNCHALGASYKKKFNYAAYYADIVTLSFHPVKVITTGEGGAVLSNNKRLIEIVKNLRSHGIVRSNNQNTWEYKIDSLGYNYRITDFQCALGVSQLKKLTKFVKKRRFLAKIYMNRLKNTKSIILPKSKNNIYHSYHLFPLQIEFNSKFTRKKLFNAFIKNNIKPQVHYIPIHLHNLYKKKFKFKKGFFPNAELFYSREVSLPIYYSLKEKTIIKIINIIKNFF